MSRGSLLLCAAIASLTSSSSSSTDHAPPLLTPRPPTYPPSFPIPFVIAGRWCLPLPAPSGIKFVVGQPIQAPPLEQEGAPSEAEVEAQHKRFYAALCELWDHHAPGFPGYADIKLVVV